MSEPSIPEPSAGVPSDAGPSAGSDGYRAMRSGTAAAPIERDVVVADGPAATAFLQGQLSADVAALAAGASTWSWVLQPNGKVEALIRVTRIEADRFALDTDPGWGDALLTRLKRFRLRTKVEFDQPGWRGIALRGPDAQAPALGAGIEVVADASWPGLVGYDLLGPAPGAPADAVALDPAELEIARVEAGIVRMGAELNERTIPAETGLVGRTVSFTKGCYTGQELVARIDSRGSNVARHLRGLLLSAGVDTGVALRVGEKEVGVVTSVAVSPQLGPIALAYVRRAVEVSSTVELGDGITAVVTTLPLIP